MKGPYTSISQIKQAAENSQSSRFYFSPNTMRAFNSRVLPYVYGGRYFITSERMDSNHDRTYTIRECDEAGEIRTVGKFEAFTSSTAARNAAEKLAQE